MATVALAQATKEELVHKARGMAASLHRYKAKAAHATEMVVPALASTAGGAFAGVLAVKYPTIGNTQAPTDAVVGLGCVVAAAMGWGGKYNEALAAFGGGLGAVAAARMTEEMLRK